MAGLIAVIKLVIAISGITSMNQNRKSTSFFVSILFCMFCVCGCVVFFVVVLQLNLGNRELSLMFPR